MKEFLDAGKSLLPRYNPQSFFILSIYSIPAFYAQEAYPSLFKDETPDLLGKYGLVLKTLLEPEVPSEDIRKERRIIGLKERTPGVLIRNVLIDIFAIFQLPSIRIFFDVEDEFENYLDYTKGRLEQSIVMDEFEDLISDIEDIRSTDNFDKERKCSSSKYSFYYSRNYGEKESTQGAINGGSIGIGYGQDTKVNYTEFISFLAPQMLHGLGYMRPIKGKRNRFSWLCFNGWE